MSDLTFSLLGSPVIERGGSPIGVDTRKAIALLAYLAVTKQAHRRDTLATLFWPEYDQTHARATLRRTLSSLHKALGSDCLTIERETIGMRPSAELRLDVDEFHRRLAESQTHGHAAYDVCAACLAPLAAAVALYRDDFMAGFSLRDSPAFDDWQFFQREAYRREVASALARLTRGYSAESRFDTAIDTARQWLALDRLHEPAHRSLMRLYAWSGRRAAALRQYRECVQALDQELGVAPLDATVRLYEAIKDNRTPAPPARATAMATRARRTAPAASPATAATESATDSRFAAGTPSAPSRPYPLVGRSAEWETLMSAFAGVRADGQVIALEGEAGIGKTRLAEEFVARAHERGAASLAARCYPGESGLAYAPVAALLHAALTSEDSARRLGELPESWLREAARLVPELERVHPGLAPAPPLDSPGAQSHFFEGLRQVLFAAIQGATPGVLLVDDVQWADGASLDVLTYLARRLHGAPVCLLLTWRSAETSGRQQVRQLLAEAQRAGAATTIALSRLSEPAARELLRASASPSIPADTAKRLYEETEGLPYFLVEYMRALSKGTVTPAERSWPIPGGIRDLLRGRLRDMSDTSAQVIAAGAVIGRSFDFETAREVSGRSEEETIEALEELVGQGLIREQCGTPLTALSYDFSHEKLRSLVYEETSLARRRLLHRRTARALAGVARQRRQGSGSLGQIAHHHELGGDLAAAAEHYKQAGERAKALYANVEALAHLRKALALGHPDTAGLHEDIGNVETILADYAAALESYQAALAASAPEAAARLEHKLGNVYARQGDWRQAQHHFEAALARLGASGASGARARVYADWSLVARRRGQLDQAWQLANQAKELAASAQDGRALAQAHNMLGVLASSRGDVQSAAGYLERSLALAEEVDDVGARAAALNNLALALSSLGETAQAIAHAEAALALYAAQGDRHHEAALHGNLADLLHAAGRSDDARDHVKQAVSIYAEIGVAESALQLEIWKLTEW